MSRSESRARHRTCAEIIILKWKYCTLTDVDNPDSKDPKIEQIALIIRIGQAMINLKQGISVISVITESAKSIILPKYPWSGTDMPPFVAIMVIASSGSIMNIDNLIIVPEDCIWIELVLADDKSMLIRLWLVI